MPTHTHLSDIPRPASKNVAVHIKPAAERALRDGHPWLFDGSITKVSHEGSAGDIAVIFDRKRRLLAVGLYDPESPIRVKVLHHNGPVSIDFEFFTRRLAAAIQRRAPLQESGTNGYRLVHGENDGMPGLVIDRYAETYVLKLYTAAWFPHLADVLAALDTALGVGHHPKTLILRLSRNVPERFGLHNGMALRGELPDNPVIFVENGLKFAADVVSGHKTGFFFDHRDNRATVGELANGETVLDVFAYAGAFSLYAAAGGAKSVLSLDVSAPALESAKANFALNMDVPNVAGCQHEVMVADAFDAMQHMADAGRKFSLVVVDPPSFAKSAAEVDGALMAYARLARLAVKLVKRGGVLVMASCSSRVSEEVFFNTITREVSAVGVRLDELKRTGHAIDHPVGLPEGTFPEGAYLKCLFARVW